MENYQITKLFFRLTDAKSKLFILRTISNNYGGSISVQEAENEVTSPGAEHLLDYLGEPVRMATHVLMQKHGLGLKTN